MAGGGFLFDIAAFERFAADNAAKYQNADPFPHIVQDGLFPEELLERVLDEFPTLSPEERARVDAVPGKKWSVCDEREFGETTLRFIHQLNSAAFIGALETLSGISGLIPDPHLFGGGLHETLPGGSLKMHVDFNRHERLKLDRRLNLLVYLNKDWREEYHGHLELWDKKIRTRRAREAPLFNRMAMFSTSEISWHGHPDPLACPPERTRRSIAMYYYSNGRPAAERAASHSTIYRPRPGDAPIPGSFKESLKQFIPPVFLDLVRRLGR